MRIFEILLPTGTPDRSISPHQAQKIGMLQKRMDQYVDKILDPQTSLKGREFLKSRLRDDYYELQSTLKFRAMAEDAAPLSTPKYEVYDRRTGQKVAGPYITRKRASQTVDKLDNEYGGYRYGYRPVVLNEAIHRLPLTNNDFKAIEEMMMRPIPAAVASIYIQDCIDDDELNAELSILEDTEPSRDVRPLIASWFDRVMPDQMYRFRGENERSDMNQQCGILSPIHGYDPKAYHGQNDPISGDAYGSL